MKRNITKKNKRKGSKMGKRFEAKTLEEVYEKATKFFRSSITKLDIKIIQAPTNGFLGFFAKPAIVEITKRNKKIKI